MCPRGGRTVFRMLMYREQICCWDSGKQYTTPPRPGNMLLGNIFRRELKMIISATKWQNGNTGVSWKHFCGIMGFTFPGVGVAVGMETLNHPLRKPFTPWNVCKRRFPNVPISPKSPGASWKHLRILADSHRIATKYQNGNMGASWKHLRSTRKCFHFCDKPMFPGRGRGGR